MAPVPAPKKFWIFDGSVEQYPSVLASNSVHMGRSCTGCHGGDDTKNTRAEAHSDSFEAIPGGSYCQSCHSSVAQSAAGSLHTTTAGYPAILGTRGFDTSDPVASGRNMVQCQRCHVANAAGEAACGHCHVSVPNQAGGGLLAGHAFQETPSEQNNCTACHGSRVKDEFDGLNNALLSRNKAAYDAGSPWKEPSFSLQPDVHKTAGLNCMDCHTADEMHGVGAPADDDRYAVTTAPACDDCHGAGKQDATAFAAVGLHTEGHLAAMDCQVCHSQPYKNCFSCHTDVTDEDLPFFTSNSGDPTLADRKAAASDPSTVFPDSLMTFRAGINPKWEGPSDTENKQYSVLRHPAVDSDTLAYTGANRVEGLFPDFADLPTWKHATPHNIVLSTEITQSCGNCHGSEYVNFWLTDPLADAEGWLLPPYEAEEQAANADLLITAPIPTAP